MLTQGKVFAAWQVTVFLYVSSLFVWKCVLNTARLFLPGVVTEATFCLHGFYCCR